jgi:hypothetical protein
MSFRNFNRQLKSALAARTLRGDLWTAKIKGWRENAKSPQIKIFKSCPRSSIINEKGSAILQFQPGTIM